LDGCKLDGPLFHFAVWTNRVLTVISIVLSIVNLTVIGQFMYGVFHAIIAAFVSFTFNVSPVYILILCDIYI